MKKLACLLLCLLPLVCSCALAQIEVGKRDLSLNAELTRDVTNILVLLQDGEATDTLMIASINSGTGRAVMTRVDGALSVSVPEAGEVALRDVYALGEKNSRGRLAMRTVNELLALNVSTYLALDVSLLPELVDVVEALNMDLTQEEADALSLAPGIVPLTGEQALDFVRLRLPGDDPARSRGYDALMQLLYQGLHESDMMGLLSIGTKLLGSMDTNLNPMTAIALATAVQGGDEGDRRELSLPGDVQDVEGMREALFTAVYE